MRNLLVTVGSTKYDDLIEAIQIANDNGTLEKFINKFKLNSLIIQHGRSPAPKITAKAKVNVEIVDYIKPERMSDLLNNSTVIISHGGAGTIFEVLRNKSEILEAFVVVENATLMDSHQSELIDALLEMKCPLQRVRKDFKAKLFNDIKSEKAEIADFILPEPNYKPLASLINSWL